MTIDRLSQCPSKKYASSGLIVGLLTMSVLTGCAHRGTVPLDAAVEASVLAEPAKPVEVIEVPTPLPLPNQLKRLPEEGSTKPEVRVDPRTRVARATEEARVVPAQEGFINAIQVWPYSEGALYQLYTSPGRVTVVSLQPGEELISFSAGDTVRWIVGDTLSGAGPNQRVNLLVKPVRSGLKTNLVVSTSKRTYLLELTSTERAWMASASWDYPQDQALALQRQSRLAEAQAPVAEGVQLEQIKFRYRLSGDRPAWKPVRVFDDGRQVFIQFPARIAQGELPPLFVIGTDGTGELVNYRYRAPYYVVDRLFGVAELRLGARRAQIVRISRTDLNTGARHDDQP